MQDEVEPGSAEIAVLSVGAMPGVDAWSVQIVVPHVRGVVTGWAPYLFWSRDAANRWLAHRVDAAVRPTVRDCPFGPNDRAYAALVGDDGAELLLSEPVDRIQAAGVAATFAAAFRAA